MKDIYELGCTAGLLNYIDHETPRVYFVHAHAELEDFEAFCKALVDDCDAEIKMLREVLKELLDKTEGLFALVHNDPYQTKAVYPRFILNARAALGEKQNG